MERRPIKETVVRIIADHLGLPPATLNPQSHICSDLGADSFDHIELMITIEERFGVKIPHDEINTLQRISDIIPFLERVLPQQEDDIQTEYEEQKF